MGTAVTVNAVYRFLLTPRWIALLLIAILTVPGCLWLAGWQFDRLHEAQQDNNRVSDNAAATAVPVTDLTGVGSTVRADDEYRTVTVAGRYDTARQLFVRNRPRDGTQGFHLLTPLVTPAGPAVLVDRGFVAAPVSGSPEAPESPPGPVTVTGHLRPTEDQLSRGPRDAADVPTGQVVRIDVPRISETLPYPVYGGYVQLAEQQPAAPVVDGRSVPHPVDLPDTSSELLHRSYAWQWYVFAAIGPIGFVLLARREAAERTESAAKDQERQHI